MTTAVGIITYNPDIARLKRALDAIHAQTDMVYLYDNHSENAAEVQSLLGPYAHVAFFAQKENRGISVGLNEIARLARAAGHQWLLTLDQDSVCPNQMVLEFLKYVSLPDAALLCPRVVDYRQVYRYAFKKPPERDYEPVSLCITAGSFVNLEVWNDVGGFDETLFIDYVDYEYCYRLRSRHYAVYQINTVVLDQELGDLEPAKHAAFFLKAGERLHSRLIMSFACKKRYSSIRRYYATRNQIYCARKYPRYHCALKETFNLIYVFMKMLLLSAHKWAMIEAMIHGVSDGKRMPL